MQNHDSSDDRHGAEQLSLGLLLVRFIARAVTALFLAMVGVGGLFFVIAGFTELLSAGMHSAAAVVFLSIPIVWGIVFWLLGRIPALRLTQAISSER